MLSPIYPLLFEKLMFLVGFCAVFLEEFMVVYVDMKDLAGSFD